MKINISKQKFEFIKKKLIISKKWKEIEEYLIDLDLSEKERFYCWNLDIEPKKCLCGNKITFKNLSKGYVNTFCSNKCSFAIKQIKENRINTNLQRYGVKSNFSLKSFKEKRKNTWLEKYGIDSPLKSKFILNKVKKTNLERYGVEFILQEKGIREKIKNTNLQKYGTIYPLQNENIKEKIKQTYLERYGTEFIFQSEIIKNKIKQTNLQRYGFENSSKNLKVKETYKKTCLKKFNSFSYFSSEKHKNFMKENKNLFNYKRHETKKTNGTYKISKKEEEIYDLLKLKFKNIIREYKSEIYPWSCDFYLKDENIFIEYQGMWTHGYFPYIENDIKCQKQLLKWKEKSKFSNFYKKAIQVWTINDIKKRTFSITNNLNWLEFFNMEQFLEWYEKI